MSRIRGVRIVADLVSNDGSMDPLHISPEVYVSIYTGNRAPIQIHETISDVMLLTQGVFDVLWKLMGNELKKQLQRAVDEDINPDTSGG